MDLKRKVGQRVQAIRVRRGLTQEALAEQVGRSAETISSLERGKSFPNYQTLGNLSEALNVPVRDFFDFRSKPDSPSAKRVRLEDDVNEALTGLKDRELTVLQELISLLINRG